jgi:hypothetical protein
LVGSIAEYAALAGRGRHGVVDGLVVGRGHRKQWLDAIEPPGHVLRGGGSANTLRAAKRYVSKFGADDEHLRFAGEPTCLARADRATPEHEHCLSVEVVKQRNHDPKDADV